MDRVLQEDLEAIAKSDLPYDAFNHKTVLITGATGLIGASLVRALVKIANTRKIHVKIFALVRDQKKAYRIFGDLDAHPELSFVIGDIINPIMVWDKIDYIIHCASVTASKTMVTYPVETIMTSVLGTKNILDLAQRQNTESVVYISSMEMYGAFDESVSEVTESDIGFIDPLAVRSNYPESKRLCENMCEAYLQEYNVPVKIARLAQTFGAGILEGENRIFAQFARSVIENRNIVLHTKGQSEGNYCYLRDVVLGVFTILLKGKNGEAYNVSNPETHATIANMAQMVCEKVANNKIKVEFDIPADNKFGYAADTKMKLNSDKLQNLGWKPEIGLEEAYRRLICSMMSNGECK